MTNFTQTLAYSKALARGIQLVDANFRVLAKLDEENLFEHLQDYAWKASELLDFAHFARNEDELDEVEMDVIMSLHSDLTSYISNEIKEMLRIRKEVTFANQDC